MASTIDHPALPKLKAQFPSVAFQVAEFREQVTVVVPSASIADVCRFLKADADLGFDQLTDLFAIDYLGYPGAQHRFAVDYLLLNTVTSLRLRLKVFLDPTQDTKPGSPMRDEDAVANGDPGLKLESVYSIWPVADWMEREAYDLMGIVFVGHPDLRRIMTWNGFGSHPLRKDYPLRGIGEREDYKVVTREGA
jgi:NADH-quinone oxidoreductase subunit C